MYKLVVNRCYGGFNLSEEACEFIFDNMTPKERADLKSGFDEEESISLSLKDYIAWRLRDLPRHHRLLVQAVEKYGEEVNGICSALEICEIEERRYNIREYAGLEWVETPEKMVWTEIE